jgi:tripartite-type tricarboxylate transporter receptor subunit TctC
MSHNSGVFMKLRHVIAAMAALLCLTPAQAQDYPNKPIRIVVPFPAGGTTDIITRAVAQKLSEEWKQPVVVDNRPGGGANIGADHVVRSVPDGYTLLMASTAHSINASLYPKMTYDPVKDFTPITMLAETAQVLVVHPSLPVNTVRELIDYLKTQSKPVSYSSAGNGSQPHLSTELFKMMSGTHMLHVPYKGGPQAMTDLIAGHVMVSLATAPSAVQNVKTGKVKALGVSTKQRIPALPDVPTISASGLPGYEASGYFGLVGPPQLPAAIVNKLNAALLKIVREPAMSKYLSEQGADPVTSTPAEYAALIRDEVEKWGKVVKATGAQID